MPTLEEQEALDGEKKAGMNELAKEYDERDLDEKVKPLPKSIDDFGHKRDPNEPRPKTMQELEDEWQAKQDADDEEAPDLEEVDQAELERTK